MEGAILAHRRQFGASIVCACALAALAGLAIGWPAIRGRAYLLRDLAGQFYPWRAYARAELAEGVLPLWNPYNQGGNPLAANPQTQLFYPPAAVLLTGSFGPALMGFLAGHAALAAVGMFVLLRMHGCVTWAAMLGGAVYALSGWSATRLEFVPVFATAAWAPLVMAALLGCVRKPSCGRALGASALLALQCLAGSPNHFFICGLAYAVVVGLAVVRVAARSPRAAAQAVLALAGVGVLAVALCAVLLMPLFEFSALSLRAGSLDFEFASRRALFPAQLKTLVAPFAYGGPGHGGYSSSELREFWNGCYYVGILPLVLITVAAVAPGPADSRRPGRRVFAAGLVVIALLGLSLALGRLLPVFRWCHQYLPVFGKFRWPSKFMFLVVFALAGLAGLSLDRIMLALRGRRQWGYAVAVGALAWVLVDLSLFAVRITPTTAADFFAREARCPTDTRSVRVLCDKRSRSLHNYLYGSRSRQAFEWARRLLLGYGNLLEGVDAAHADDPLVLRQFGRVLAMAEDDATPALVRTRLLRMLGVGEIRAAKDVDALDLDAIENPEAHMAVTAAPKPLPRAWVASKAITKPSGEIGWLAAKGFEPARMVILPIGAAAPSARSSGGTAKLAHRRAHDVEIELSAGSEGWLVLSDAACPGWAAYTDGVRTPILLANFCMRAVRLAEGAARVRFVYQPRSIKWGAGCSLIALAVIVLVAMAKLAGPR